MKRKLKVILTLLLVISVVMAYTGISFAADGEDVQTGGPSEEQVTDGTDTGTDGGQIGQQATQETGKTADNEPAGGQTGGNDVVNEPAGGETGLLGAAGDGGPEGEDAAENETPDIDISDYTVELEYTESLFAAGSVFKPDVVSVKDADGVALDPEVYDVSYTNNDKAGTAQAKVTAKKDSGYTGEATADFTLTYFGKVTSISYKYAQDKRSSNSIYIKWNAAKKTTGYRLYLNGKLKATVNGKTEYNITGLKANTAYKIKVQTYTDDAEGREITRTSNEVTVYTAPSAPGKVTISSAKTVKPYVLVKWKQASGTFNGYQIQYSTSSNFSGAKVLYVSNKATVSKKVYNLTNNKKYYFRVRTYRKAKGGYSFGPWSSKKAATAKSTGWMTYGGWKYYYRNGALLKGQNTIGSEPYFFDSDGVYRGASKGMWDNIKGASSKTKYLVSISIKYHRVNVFTKVKGVWTPKYQWKCATGRNDSTKTKRQFTPRGSWLISGKKLNYMTSDGHTAWLATNFYKSCYMHSIIYKENSKTEILDGNLGDSRSGGCVRLAYKNAEWIFKNIKKGTRVVSYFL